MFVSLELQVKNPESSFRARYNRFKDTSAVGRYEWCNSKDCGILKSDDGPGKLNGYQPSNLANSLCDQ